MAETQAMTNNVEKILSLLSGDAVTNESFINKFGENNAIDTADANQVIWPVNATTQAYTFIDSPIQLTIKSTSLNDTLLGTGARTVRVSYHDSNGENASIDIDMDGTTSVNVNGSSYGAFRIQLLTTGSGNTNAGDITVENGGTIYCIMKAGEGQTQVAVQRIPNNITSAVVKYARVDYGRTGPAGSAVMRLRVRKPDGTVLTKLNPIVTNTNATFEREFSIGGITVEGGDWVYWEAISVSANDTPIQAYFDIRETF